MTDLESVLQQLHDSEINAGVQTFYDAGMKVWIGDEANDIRTETAINRTGSFAAKPSGRRSAPARRLRWRQPKPAE
jgi:hypothetical protein